MIDIQQVHVPKEMGILSEKKLKIRASINSFQKEWYLASYMIKALLGPSIEAQECKDIYIFIEGCDEIKSEEIYYKEGAKNLIVYTIISNMELMIFLDIEN